MSGFSNDLCDYQLEWFGEGCKMQFFLLNIFSTIYVYTLGCDAYKDEKNI